MSELKAYIAPTADGTGLADYYLKSEADKVIDFWKNESHNHYERWFNLNKQYEGWFGKVCRCERAERELRRQKYKRCLAMAKWCKASSLYYFHISEEETDKDKAAEYWNISEWYDKWEERWMELAEKFKPNKE